MCSGGRWIVVATIQDVTERKNSQARLVQFRAALDQSPDALIAGRPREHAEAGLQHHGGTSPRSHPRGIPRDQPFGTRWQSSSRERLERLYDEAIAMAPRIQTQEAMYKGPRGMLYPAEVTRRAVQIDGRWVIVICSRDISERKRAQEELQRRMEDLARSNQELERFAYVASHDLGAAAHGRELHAAPGAPLPGPARRDGDEFIDFAMAPRMQRLIADLLAYSRVGAREGPARDPARRSRRRAGTCARRSRRAGATVTYSALPVVPADARPCQLLQNLVGNAVKFRGRGAAGRGRRVESGARAGLLGADNGIGIAPEHFERIFLIFQRLHAREEYPGTGIGLAICKKIVERHGGRIWVESEPGQGTTFRFTLPRKTPGQEGGNDPAPSIGRK